MKLNSVITFTTDFASADPYVGIMQGVILSINPQCTFIDITHEITPQDIIHGCFALSVSYNYFPKGTIHVAVVDPGVGSNRRAIIVETDMYIFVGPDNGIFSFVLDSPDVAKVTEITNAAYFRPSPSTTFHGRDIFAPVAAHLSKGIPPQRFGSPVTDYVLIRTPEPVLQSTGAIEGEILHIDRFGNLITNITRRFLEKHLGDTIIAGINGIKATRLLQTYTQAEDDELFCLFGSSGHLEVSVKNKSAQEITRARRGDKIIVICDS